MFRHANIAEVSTFRRCWRMLAIAKLIVFILIAPITARELPKAFIDGSGIGWTALGEQDFVNVNCSADTWTWKDRVLSCTGQPTGVLRTRRQYTNFELVAQWKHLKSGGNSGIFLWAAPDSIKDLKPGEYPQGVEVQILDPGYIQLLKQSNKRNATDWLTAHGDVFPVNGTRMKPFPPVSPNGERSFPRKQLTREFGNWNHYYVRCVNGEVRLWVNGEEVSGGDGCDPSTGYLCLESEGSPIDFADVRIRELP